MRPSDEDKIRNGSPDGLLRVRGLPGKKPYENMFLTWEPGISLWKASVVSLTRSVRA